MEKRGWRAVIYDAPWARFKPGQVGVIISEDGRQCETLDDDLSGVIIEVDPNDSTQDKSNGHVLFRQKGSDLFDIVCIAQGGKQNTYTLGIANPIELSICTANYDRLVDALKNNVILTVNDNEPKYLKTNQYAIIDPKPEDDGTDIFTTTGNKTFKLKTTKNVPEVKYEGTFNIVDDSDEKEIWARSEIQNYGNPTIECSCTATTVINGVNSSTNSFEGNCQEHSVTFSIDETTTVDYEDVLNVTDIVINEVYKKMKCGVVNGTVRKDGSIKDAVVTFDKNIDDFDINTNGTSIELSFRTNYTSITANITLLTNEGGSVNLKQFTFINSQTSCTNSAQP